MSATNLNAPLSPLGQFDLDYAARRRRAKLTWALATIIFTLVFVFSAWLGDFFKVTQVTNVDGSREWRWILPAGLPRLA